jgi:hypothetical protein
LPKGRRRNCFPDAKEEKKMAINHIEHGEVLTPIEARQGLISGRVLLVLMASLSLVIAVFAAIYVWGI